MTSVPLPLSELARASDTSFRPMRSPMPRPGMPSCARLATTSSKNFETIPLFDLFIEVIVDPKIVADWPFPGWDGGDVGHTWRIMACKRDKPCRE